jgi:hypothetical protein
LRAGQVRGKFLTRARGKSFVASKIYSWPSRALRMQQTRESRASHSTEPGTAKQRRVEQGEVQTRLRRWVPGPGRRQHEADNQVDDPDNGTDAPV